METHGNRRGPRSEINVTPLVDVCLVLLIIFMVVLPTLQAGYLVKTPPAKPGTAAGSRQVVLRMDGQGRTYLNGERVPRTELALRIAAMDLGNKLVFFAADGELPYGEVAEFMDLCRSSGAGKLGIVFEDLERAGT
jgi:biopolymer transport protein TolR